MTSPQQRQQLPPPLLLSDLSLALACLYNLPCPDQQQQQQQQHQYHHSLTLSQAQEYLIHFQARNMRRKVESLLQRQRDKPAAGGDCNRQALLNPPQNSPETGKDALTPGSTWLASLTLLCQFRQQQSSFVACNAERLFAAQTLVHRLLRNKLKDAVDLEMEVHLDCNSFIHLMYAQCQNDPPIPVQPLMEQYQQCVQQYHFHPIIASVLSQYYMPSPEHATEERVKAEVALLTLAAILYATALDSYAAHHNNQHNTSSEQAGPLLNTLGSAIAALALRIRFPSAISSNSNNITTEPQSSTQSSSLSVVTMVTQALTLVFRTASSSSSLTPIHVQVCSDCYRACLAAVPDICVGSSGGARGRVSIDPMCLREVAVELRTTGLEHLWEALQNHFRDVQQQPQLHQEHQDKVHENILYICERWARFLPLPLEFLQHTVPLACQHIRSSHTDQNQQTTNHLSCSLRKAAFSYLVAILEGGTWTADLILAKRVGVAPDQIANHQSGKKRQSGKSKKRQQELLNARTSDTMEEEAREEAYHRGAMACHTTAMAWETLQTAFRSALAEADHQKEKDSHADIQIEGEGPIGCVAACANACLPHLLRNSSSTTTAFPQSKELFVVISDTFQEMCRSQHRLIRAFSMEAIYSLHAAMLQKLILHEEAPDVTPPLETGLQQALVDHFFKCAMSLATSCPYPEGYFNEMGAESDEDLEVERNEVRELIRVIASSERGGSTAVADVSRVPFDATVQILGRILHSCLEAIQKSEEGSCLFPETAVHCFSALAKPLNQLSKCFAQSGQPNSALNILKVALEIFKASLHSVIDGFSSTPPHQLFPLSRVVELAIASLAPMLSNMCGIPVFHDDIACVLQLCLNASAASISKFPELATQSILDDNLYDIRWAMRSPGGKDHVGCLAIMRLTVESDQLSLRIVEAAGADIQHLCRLHSQLKNIETSREKGVDYGRGVTPKSRRILLNIICRLEIVTKGAAGCSAMLTELFETAVSSIAAYATADPLSMEDENVLFYICENTWDIAAFSPSIVVSLFNYADGQSSIKLACLQVITRAICRGFQRLRINDESSAVDLQWNRLRAAFFMLLKTAGMLSIPGALIESLENINAAECEAINRQCQAGPASLSSLFNDELVSGEMVPPGLFVRIVQDFIVQCDSKNTEMVFNCITILQNAKTALISTLFLLCPDPDQFTDPRPTMGEAWLLALSTLAQVAKNMHLGNEHGIKGLLIDTCAAVVSMLFYPVLSKTRDVRAKCPFMSMEGPHTLAISDFLANYFLLGPAMLEGVSHQLLQRVPIDTSKASAYSSEPKIQGVAILGAALFRAAAGGLPPWFVESVPEVYSALFFALNNDSVAFGNILQLAMELRSTAVAGRVLPGHNLAGPVFETSTARHKQEFLNEAVELSRQNNHGAWKRIKVILKKVSGGKKVGTDFAQKVRPTKWDEFDRL